MEPRPKLGKTIFFLGVVDCELETFMEQYCCQMQKHLNNEAKQRSDVHIDEERIRRKKMERGTNGEREAAERRQRQIVSWHNSKPWIQAT